jgi:hypothetical protein
MVQRTKPPLENFDIRKAITLHFISITIALELHTSETNGSTYSYRFRITGWSLAGTVQAFFFFFPSSCFASSVQHDDQQPVIIVLCWTEDAEDLSYGVGLHLHLLLRRWKQLVGSLQGKEFKESR